MCAFSTDEPGFLILSFQIWARFLVIHMTRFGRHCLIVSCFGSDSAAQNRRLVMVPPFWYFQLVAALRHPQRWGGGTTQAEEGGGSQQLQGPEERSVSIQRNLRVLAGNGKLELISFFQPGDACRIAGIIGQRFWHVLNASEQCHQTQLVPKDMHFLPLDQVAHGEGAVGVQNLTVDEEVASLLHQDLVLSLFQGASSFKAEKPRDKRVRPFLYGWRVTICNQLQEVLSD